MDTEPVATPPEHVAIIMDGNGRWAQAKGLPRIEGHRAGAESVRRVLEACADLGIRYLTLYAFSTENWRRPAAEVGELMRLLATFLQEHLKTLQKRGVRLRAIGELDKLPVFARTALQRVIKATANNDRHVLTLALSYGARAEIVAAARSLARDVANGTIRVDDIDETTFASRLYTADIPDPDLIIRTANEKRLSNFLLWQASYAEFWVTPTCWPEFTGDDLQRAVADFSCRKRRFGGLPSA